MGRKFLIALAITTMVLGLMLIVKLNYLSREDNDTFENHPLISSDQPTAPEIVASSQVVMEKALALGVAGAQRQIRGKEEWQQLRKTIRDLRLQTQQCVLAVLSEQPPTEDEIYHQAIVSAAKRQGTLDKNLASITEDIQKEKEAKMKACYEPLEAIAQVVITSEDPDSLFEIATDRNLQKNRQIAETIQLLKSAAKKGNEFAAQHLGQLYYYGLEYPEKYEELLQKYDEVRQRTDLFSETDRIELGLQGDFYRNGEVKQDISQALYWFEQAQTHWRSLLGRNYIAELSFLGKGVPRDFTKAQDEIAKDAEMLEKFDPTLGEGQNSLYEALIYSDVENPQRNIERAIAALDKAEERNSVIAKVYRAHLSWFGHQVPLDTTKIEELLQDQDRGNKKTPLTVALWILSEKFSAAKQKSEFEFVMREEFESGSNGLEQAYLGIGFGFPDNSLTDSARSEKWLLFARKNGVWVNRNCRSLAIDPGKFPHLGSLANDKTFDADTSNLRCHALLDHLARLSTLRTMVEQDREVFWSSYGYRAKELLDAFAKREFVEQREQATEAISGKGEQSKELFVSDPEVDDISRQIDEAIEKRKARKEKEEIESNKEHR